MPADVKPSFLDLLRASQLLATEQLDELAGLPEANDADPRPLARQVFQRGWLTRYQLSQVANGKAKTLFLGQYILLERLGEGGMGQVFSACHRRMDRVVALKVIRRERLAGPEAVQRFYAEVRAAAQLNHPNIVLAYDADEVGGVHYLSMEYVEGFDLARLVKENGPLPPVQACDYVRQAALGLQHAHEKGMVHRDIKPHNLLAARAADAHGSASLRNVNPDGGAVVKILDMGLARLQGTTEKERALTQLGSVIGTPDYLAPEQAIDSRSADIRSDLYSLGCTFYFLLTGRPPFAAETLAEILLKHQMEEPQPLEQLRPEVPAAVAAVVRKLMAKRPRDRYATPAELVRDLEPLCRGEVPALPPAPDGPALTPADSPSTETMWNTIVEEAVPAPRRRSGGDDRTAAGSRIVGAGAPRPYCGQPAPGGRKKTLLIGGAVAVPVVALIVTLAIVLNGDGKSDGDGGDAGGGGPPVVIGGGGEKPPVPPPVPPAVPEAPTPGMEAKLFAGHAGPVNCVAVSPDSQTAVSGGADGSARLWDLQSGKELFHVEGLAGPVLGVGFSADGKSFFASTGPEGLRQWNIATRQEVGAARDGTYISPGGRVALALALSAEKPSVQVWDLSGGKERARFPLQEPCPFPSVSFSADESRGILASGGKHFYHFDLPTRKLRLRSVDGSNCLAVACSPDGRVAVVARDDGPPMAVAVEGRTILRQFEDRGQGKLRSLAFLPSGRHVLSGGEDGVVMAWDVETGKPAGSPFLGHKGPVTALTVTKDGRRALSAGEDGSIRLWDLSGLPSNPKPPVVVRRPDPKPADPKPFEGGLLLEMRGGSVRALAVSPHGGSVVVADGAVGLGVWNLFTGRRVRYRPGLGNVSGGLMTFSPDGKLLAVPVGPTVRLIQAGEGKVVRDLQKVENARGIRKLAFSPDGRYLLAGVLVPSGPNSLTSEVHLWEASTGKHLTALNQEKPSLVNALAFSSDGGRALAYTGDKLRAWEMPGGKELKAVQLEHSTRSAFTVDGRLLAFGGRRHIKLWDVEKGRELREISLPEGHLISLSAPGGRIVASFGGYFPRDPADRTKRPKPDPEQCLVVVWDAKTGRELHRLKGHADHVRFAEATVDGRFVVSAGRDNFLRVWDLSAAAGPATTEAPVAGPARFIKGYRYGVRLAHFLPGGRILTSDGGSMRLEDVSRGRVLGRCTFNGSGPDSRSTILPGGKHLLYVTPKNIHLRLFDLEKRQVIREYKNNDVHILDVAVSPDSKWFATGGGARQDDHEVWVWNLSTGKLVATLRGHPDPVRHLAFTADGRSLVSGAADGFRVWDFRKQALRRHIVPAKRSGPLDLSADGRRALSLHTPKTLTVWDIESGKPVHQCSHPGQRITNGALVGDGDRVLLAGFEEGPAAKGIDDSSSPVLWLVEAATGKVLLRMEGHPGRLLHLKVSPDGRHAVSTALGPGCLWDLESKGTPGAGK